MIIKYTKTLAVSLFIVILIILSSICSIGNSTNEIDNKEEYNRGSVSIIKTQVQNISSKIYTSSFFDNGFSNTENIVVTNTTDDESYPSVVFFGFNGLIAYENKHENKTSVYLRNSVNYGQSWSNEFTSISTVYNSFSPSSCLKPKSKTAYCAAVSDHNKSAVLFDIEIPSIDKINMVYAYFVDWRVFGFYNFSKPDIVYYSDPNYPNVSFMTVVIGSTTYSGGPCKNTPMFFYRTPDDPNSSTIAWDAAVENCSNVSASFDSTKKIIYGACEIRNNTKTNILFFSDNPITWSENSSLKYKIISWEENLTHPNIFFAENQIYITAETETNGIVIYTSSNNGATWNLHNVTKDVMPDAEPKHPVLYANQNIVYCVFTESGNIFITSSSDFGKNWSVPIQLNSQNNSVVEEYKFHDISDEEHVFWTDGREGKNDIYSILKNIPEIDLTIVPESVNITAGEYPIFPTKNWITFTIKNNGKVYVEDVIIEINFTCKNITRSTKYPAYIFYLDGGAEKTFYKPLFRMTLSEFIQALRSFAGLQNITITVDAYKKYIDLNPDDNVLTIDVKYADIFPKLYFLEKIFSG